MENPIFSIFERVERSERPLIIFDIDSTLMNTGGRNFAILEEAADERADLSSFTSKLSPELMGWNPIDDVRSLGCDDRELLDWFINFWSERFFTDSYVKKDIAYPGAADYVKRLIDCGARVKYLTGRDLPNMSEGTLESFRMYGFPVEGPVDFEFKPCYHMDDREFKMGTFENIRKSGMELVASFENDPANANAFCEHFPDCAVFLIDTVVPPGSPEPVSEVVNFKGYL